MRKDKMPRWSIAVKQHMCTGGCMREIDKGEVCWTYCEKGARWLWRCETCQKNLVEELEGAMV